MGVLDSVLAYKAQKEAQANADLQAIPQGIAAFTAAKQAANDNLLKQLTLKGSLAEHGLRINPAGNDIMKDPSLEPNKKVYQMGIGPDGVPTLMEAGTVSKGDTVKSAPSSSDNSKSFEAFGKVLDPTQNVRTPLGIAKIAYDKAERLQSLSNQFPDGNLDSRQLEELAIGFNSLLQGGAGSGGGAQAIIGNLVPKSAVGNAMKMKEWLTNNPQGTQQQEFVKRMMGTVEREKATTAAQIKRTQLSRIAPFSGLEQQDPNKFNQILLSNGIDPKEYADWKSGGYKQIDASQPGTSTSSSNSEILIDPNGVKRSVSKDKIEAAIKAGFKRGK